MHCLSVTIVCKRKSIRVDAPLKQFGEKAAWGKYIHTLFTLSFPVRRAHVSKSLHRKQKYYNTWVSFFLCYPFIYIYISICYLIGVGEAIWLILFFGGKRRSFKQIFCFSFDGACVRACVCVCACVCAYVRASMYAFHSFSSFSGGVGSWVLFTIPWGDGAIQMKVFQKDNKWTAAGKNDKVKRTRKMQEGAPNFSFYQ